MERFVKTLNVTVSLHFLFMSLMLFSSLRLGASIQESNVFTFCLGAASLLISPLFYLKKYRNWSIRVTNDLGARQSRFLADIDSKHIGLLIILSAGLSLFLELALIRWHSSIFTVFSFHKNFTLLACFVGLGLGYAGSKSTTNTLFLFLPALAVQLLFLLTLRYQTGSYVWMLMVAPIGEETYMGPPSFADIPQLSVKLLTLAHSYGLLGLTFALTVLVMFPVGQLCGHFVDRRPRLDAYGKNLLGSLGGVLAFFLLSYSWAPPPLWFSIVITIVMLFLNLEKASRVLTIAASGVIMVLLLWPYRPVVQKIFSPYQIIERTAEESNGLMKILASGTYFQKVYNFSPLAQAGLDQASRDVLGYYDLPYKIQSYPQRVAIVGAGSGNDVAAALRAGAKEIDAIEIDPTIVALGRVGHPERPYSDARVNVIVNDARSFFRTSRDSYDAIVYGVLDSHGQLSHISNVRLDSFVYTVEGIRESFARLNDGGILALTFALTGEVQGHRIFEMLRQAAGGGRPTVVRVGYDSKHTTTFLIRRGRDSGISTEAIRSAGFEDVTARYYRSLEAVDLPTDDWPFFYMKKRIYPVSYVFVLVFIMALTVVMTRKLGAVGAVSGQLLAFFFLGAGFMLIETKAITEFGLLFGNTWQVVGVVVSAILLLAYLANLIVEKIELRQSVWAYVGLFAAIIVGYWAVGLRWEMDYQAYRFVILALLTLPIFFSGLVFSIRLAGSSKRVSEVFSYNIIGAMFGGLLEYNSMYFGFSWLYLLALVIYLLSMVTSWQRVARVP